MTANTADDANACRIPNLNFMVVLPTSQDVAVPAIAIHVPAASRRSLA
jgi:hypothetical protein